MQRVAILLQDLSESLMPTSGIDFHCVILQRRRSRHGEVKYLPMVTLRLISTDIGICVNILSGTKGIIVIKQLRQRSREESEEE